MSALSFLYLVNYDNFINDVLKINIRGFLMSFRTRRVLMSTPLIAIFEFFLMKYLFLLFGGLNDLYLFWIWMSLFFFFDILFIYIIGAFVKLPFYLIVVLLLLVPIITIYSYWHAHRIIVHEKTIELDKIKQDINIVHLSDVHFGAIRHKKIILDLRDKLNELSSTCDLAIISGDLADGSCVVEEDDFLPLKDVNIPIVFTAGNHDFYPGIENVYKA